MVKHLHLIAAIAASLFLVALSSGHCLGQPVFQQKSDEAVAKKRAEFFALRKGVVNHFNAGRYAEAEAAAKYLLRRATAELGPSTGAAALGHFELGRIYQRVGRFKEAEQHARRGLAILDNMPGDTLAATGAAGGRMLLGLIQMQQDRLAEAEVNLKRAVAAYGQLPDRAEVAETRSQSLRWLGVAYMRQGRLGEAETVLRRAVAENEKRFGPDSIWTVHAIHSLGQVLVLRGQLTEAEALFKRATTSLERSGVGDRSMLADVLSHLASFYVDQGRVEEAEPIYKRAAAGYVSAHGLQSHLTAAAQMGLGQAYMESNRLDDAIRTLRQALRVFETTRGPAHADTAQILVHLGHALMRTGQLGEAESLLRRALEIQQKVLGAEHFLVGRTHFAIGRRDLAAQRIAEAETSLQKALQITEKAAGAEHPETASVLNALGDLLLLKDATDEALPIHRRASLIIAKHAETTAGIRSAGRAADLKPQLRHGIHASLVAASWQSTRTHPQQGPELLNEALLAAQRADSTLAGAAVSQMASRFAAGNDALAELLRKAQDLAHAWQELDKELTQSLGGEHNEEYRTTPKDRVIIAKELDRLGGELAALNRRLGTDFPAYTALARSTPLGVSDIQALLSDDEALVAFLSAEQGTFVWAITRTAALWHKSELDARTLGKDIEALRCGLEGEVWSEEIGTARCVELGLRAGQQPPYDLTVAHRVYQALFGPIVQMIDGKSLLLVPSGVLTGLSFHALVTEPPSVALPDSAGYKGAAWFVQRHASSVLPSISSFKALRTASKAPTAAKPLIGYAAPVFAAEGTALTRGKVGVTRGYGAFYKGARASLDDLRLLAPLPETETELRSIALSLGASEADLIFGPGATEASVKRAKLLDYRVVYFATHGLVAGQVLGLGEPALVLTLPAVQSELDDGLLSASEVARLKLNADWVVLSACNTAAGTKPGAEALSGLARAFFYAGARALLVTHWQVYSSAAVELTTATFASLAADPQLGRSQALQRAMLDIIDKADGYRLHPSYWAAFVVVGDGRAPVSARE